MGKAISSQADRKRCSKCKSIKPLTHFVFRPSKQRYSSRCRDCISQQNRAYYERNAKAVKAHVRKRYWGNIEAMRAASNAETKRRYHAVKTDVVLGYGGKCTCCGERDIRFLTIDHVEENGAHLRRIGAHPTGLPFLKWLRKRNYPTDFQLLCYNCNCGKHRNAGVCPHKDPRSDGSETISQESRFKRTQARGTPRG